MKPKPERTAILPNAVMGFLTGVVGAWFYNLIAKWIGGIEVK